MIVWNKHSLVVKSIGPSTVNSKCLPRCQLAINNLLHLPNITRNLISVSKVAKDNKVYFDFHANKCFVKSQASELVFLEGFLDGSGLYFFNNLNLDLSHKSSLSSFPKLHYFSNNTTASLRYDSVSINVDSRVMWHYMLGHVNPRAVSHVLKLCNVHVNNKNSENFDMLVA